MSDLQISKRGALELITHEGAVLSAYKDSVGVWTWGIGITDASGHSVGRYRNKPQTLERVLEVYLWALRRYETDVIEAFAPMRLKEHQLAAAVSFHYNTGGIKRASWVDKFKSGDIAGAKRSFMNWKKPEEIIPRRKAERDLFFDGKWGNKTTITIWGVHANGNVNWASRKSVDASKALDAVWPDAPPAAPVEPVDRAPVADVIDKIAAQDRMSKTQTMSGLGGAAAMIGTIKTIADDASGILGNIAGFVPDWFIPAALVIGAGAFAFTWWDRRKYKRMAREARAVL